MSDGVKVKDYRRFNRHHAVLPEDAQDVLKRAAAELDGLDAIERRHKIERAILWCKEKYPRFFRQYR